MTDPKPKLVAVGRAQNKSASHPAPQEGRRWTDLGAGFWLLALILAVAVAIIAVQTRRLDQLSVQLETLETELSAAHGALQLYESRFAEIRESVGNLHAQLGELEGLVEQPPAPAPTR
ncbi:MAG: hypothetical protein IH974_07880 [Myxococcales bacterium]|nr:hypothetical protein [Myxococcales bacterium]